MAGVRKKPNSKGKYQGWFMDQSGKQRFFWGTKSSKETKKIAEGLEAEHPQVRLGYRPAPSPAAKHQTSFGVVKDEYLAWGRHKVGGAEGPGGVLTLAIGVLTWHGGQSASDYKPWLIRLISWLA